MPNISKNTSTKSTTGQSIIVPNCERFYFFYLVMKVFLNFKYNKWGMVVFIFAAIDN